MFKWKSRILWLYIGSNTLRPEENWVWDSYPYPKHIFSYPKNPPNLGSMGPWVCMKPNLIWVLEMVMRRKLKIQTQFFSGINDRYNRYAYSIPSIWSQCMFKWKSRRLWFSIWSHTLRPEETWVWDSYPYPKHIFHTRETHQIWIPWVWVLVWNPT